MNQRVTFSEEYFPPKADFSTLAVLSSDTIIQIDHNALGGRDFPQAVLINRRPHGITSSGCTPGHESTMLFERSVEAEDGCAPLPGVPPFTQRGRH